MAKPLAVVLALFLVAGSVLWSQYAQPGARVDARPVVATPAQFQLATPEPAAQYAQATGAVVYAATQAAALATQAAANAQSTAAWGQVYAATQAAESTRQTRDGAATSTAQAQEAQAREMALQATIGAATSQAAAMATQGAWASYSTAGAQMATATAGALQAHVDARRAQEDESGRAAWNTTVTLAGTACGLVVFVGALCVVFVGTRAATLWVEARAQEGNARVLANGATMFFTPEHNRAVAMLPNGLILESRPLPQLALPVPEMLIDDDEIETAPAQAQPIPAQLGQGQLLARGYRQQPHVIRTASDPTLERDKRAVLMLLRCAMKIEGRDSRVIPSGPRMNMRPATRIAAVNLIRGYLEIKTGNGGYTRLIDRTLAEMYEAVGSGRVTLALPVAMVEEENATPVPMVP